ncbi:MAG: CoA-transferase [Desulfobacterales bacterium]|jgi:glutaconate CoA-transferase subunit A
MDTGTNKLMDLKSAVKRFVQDGGHISIGGFTVNRNPMAAVYEIIRQGKRGLHLYAHSNGQGVDELIGGGCVSRLEIAYAGSGRFAPTCIRFRKAVEQGALKVEDYSNYQMTLRFMAGAMGVPFLPTRSSLGTSLLTTWGFSARERRDDPRLPNQKVTVLDNPFQGWRGVEKVVLVPAVNPDVTILHVQKADRAGTVRIEGLTFADIEQAKAAARVIITCEELVETDALRENPDLNQLPFFCVDAVVHVPFGAYPTACYRYYDYDPAYLNAYRAAAAEEGKHAAYLRDNIFGPKDHAAFIARQGPDRMKQIAADPRTGYAVGLDRR